MDENQRTNLLISIINNPSWSKSIEEFKHKKDYLFEIQDFPNSCETLHGNWILKILFLKKQIQNSNFSLDLIENELLEESNIKLDFLISVILNYHFKIAEKIQKISPEKYFQLLFYHKELGHSECVSVLTVICLKISVLYKQFYLLNNPISLPHQGIASFYTGVIHLNNKNYLDAFQAFKYSSILRSSTLTEAFIIVSSLFLNISYKTKHSKKLKVYTEIQKYVKNGDMEKFESTILKYKEDLVKNQLFDVVKKLKSIVEEEKYKKISRVYSRIKKNDLLSLGVNEQLIRECDEIVYFDEEKDAIYNIGVRIKECQDLTEKIRGMMRYDEVPPLCVESLALDREDN